MPAPVAHSPRHLPLRWVYVYVLLIPLVNWGFAHIPTVAMFDGGKWEPMAIVTGLILIVRDFAQREVGHYVLFPLLIGLILSYLLAPPEIALASGVAFGVSEMIDYLVFTITKKPLSQRILYSAGLAGPVDSTLFLLIADAAIPGIFSWSTLITSILSKWAGAIVVYLLIHHREKKAPTTP